VGTFSRFPDARRFGLLRKASASYTLQIDDPGCRDTCMEWKPLLTHDKVVNNDIFGLFI
jgi:hypothetical protein